MAKETTNTASTTKRFPIHAKFLNDDKNLVKISGISNIAKIYSQMNKFYGEVKDTFTSAVKSRGFILEAKKDKQLNIREINSNIYFAELDFSNEKNKRKDLNSAIKSGDEKKIEKAKEKYGLAVFLNRESFKLETFENEILGNFEKWCQKNPDRKEDMEIYGKQVQEEINAVKDTFNLLQKVGIAKISEKGTMYLENFNTYKKVELTAISNEPYVKVTEEILVDAMKVADDKKELGKKAYGEKEEAPNEAKESVKVDNAEKTKDTAKEEQKTPKKRTTKAK